MVPCQSVAARPYLQAQGMQSAHGRGKESACHAACSTGPGFELGYSVPIPEI